MTSTLGVNSTFYPRPVLSLGYCFSPPSVCVCVYVWVCIHQSWVCPCDHLSRVQNRITKFGPEVQNTLVKIPFVFGINWPWPSRLNFNFKVKIYPILSLCACPHDKSLLIDVRISKFGPKIYLSIVYIPIDFGIDWPWSSVSFLISNLFIFYQIWGLLFNCVILYIFSETMTSECSTSHVVLLIYWFVCTQTGSRHGP